MLLYFTDHTIKLKYTLYNILYIISSIHVFMYVLSSSSSGLLIRVIFDLFACIENMKLKSILCREKIIKMISLMEFVMTRVIHALSL